MTDRPPSQRRARGTLELHSRIPGARVRKDHLLACARHGVRRIKNGVGHLNVILIGDRDMSRLHREYRGVPGTTDVLTFDLTDRPGGAVDGDIYISLDQARRQAREYRQPLYKEVARLAVHGVLHLAGFDDRTETGRAHMRRLEDRSLEAGARS
ncbi:MAG: rRNA maturation RNase YbeY [bacterium]|nr:rRNA maturation RNase YbeY [bacterium]